MSRQKTSIAYESRARVGRLIHRTQAEMVLALDSELSDQGITAAQYVILAAINAGRAETASQLCKEISYTPGAMTRMLDRLEDKGMISRSPYEANRRAHKVELTDNARAMFPTLLAASTAVIDRFLGVFDADELAQLEALLTKMTART
jgi:DNA-binding MarR family transcriptional regulator